MSDMYEFCPRCDANLTLQKGYDNNLPYWVCKGCGEMLINPEIPADSDIIWRCDSCNALLNVQDGFSEELDSWKCVECGFVNHIDAENLYETDAERIADFVNPYKGLSDDEVLELSVYKDISFVGDRDDVVLVEEVDTGNLYIKKMLTVYNKSVYEYLRDNPIPNMPRIVSLYESWNCLIVIEEYIKGKTVEEILNNSADGGTCDSSSYAYPNTISVPDTIRIVRNTCDTLKTLHNLSTPIIHRDIKPSNIIIGDNGNVYLLDMNAAKWYDSDKTDDTKYLGTQYYAAPEQVGFGLSASSSASDIYALGILMNVMITGTFPKEKRADGVIWDVIEKCIKLEAKDRYTMEELIDVLDRLELN